MYGQRNLMVGLIGGKWKVEGHWYRASFLPDPIAHKTPFPKQSRWLKRLATVELHVLQSSGKEYHTHNINNNNDNKSNKSNNEEEPRWQVMMDRYLRFNLLDGSFVGIRNFYDCKYRVSWQEGFGRCYVQRFNVRPSYEFITYINTTYKEISTPFTLKSSN